MVDIIVSAGARSRPAFPPVDIERIVRLPPQQRGLAHQIVTGAYLGVVLWLAAVLILMLAGCLS